MTRAFALALTVATGATVLVHAASFKEVWKSPDAAGVTFQGKKVAALVISKDDSLRMSAEEALARQLVPLGLDAVASYRIAPREELQDKDKARAWFEKMGLEGVVAM